MTNQEIKKFLMKGHFTGKIATVKQDGSSHVVPIWFVLDSGNKRSKVGDIYLTTGSDSIKAKNIQRDSRVSISVDNQTPPFSFVAISGNAKLIPYKQKEVLKWATEISRTVYGKEKCESNG